MSPLRFVVDFIDRAASKVAQLVRLVSPHRVLGAMLATFFVAELGCYSMTGQDTTATATAARLTAAAYCHLDGGGAPRALIRAAHAEEVGILRRNNVDAGPTDGTIDCP